MVPAVDLGDRGHGVGGQRISRAGRRGVGGSDAMHVAARRTGAIVSGLSRASRRGVVVRGGAALETLGRATTLVMDTLTVGHPAVVEIVAAPGSDPTEVLRLRRSSAAWRYRCPATSPKSRNAAAPEPSTGAASRSEAADRFSACRVGSSGQQPCPLGCGRDRMGVCRKRNDWRSASARSVAPSGTTHDETIAGGRTDPPDHAHPGSS